MELLFLEPVFKEAIWGGTKLRDSFGYDIPSDTTGECWAISAHKNGDCKIAGGRYDGKYLSQLWEAGTVRKLSGRPVPAADQDHRCKK